MTATATVQKTPTQPKITLTHVRQWMKQNIKNGSYIKAKVCGVTSREVQGKKDPTKSYIFHTLIVEVDLLSQKQYVDIRGQALDKKHHEMLASPEYQGKEIMLPVAISAYQGRAQMTYYGESELIIFDETEIRI